MKKRILSILAILAASFAALTSCQDEKPFSVYQIGVKYPFVGDVTLSQEEIDALPTALQEQYEMAIYLTQWFYNNDFIRTGPSGNPILIEGADEAGNDRQATQLYDNKVSELQKKDLDGIIREAQTKTGSDGKPALTLTTSGSFIFSYILTKGSNPSTIRSTSFTINYEPLETADPQ